MLLLVNSLLFPVPWHTTVTLRFETITKPLRVIIKKRKIYTKLPWSYQQIFVLFGKLQFNSPSLQFSIRRLQFNKTLCKEYWWKYRCLFFDYFSTLLSSAILRGTHKFSGVQSNSVKTASNKLVHTTKLTRARVFERENVWGWIVSIFHIIAPFYRALCTCQ